MTINKIEIQDHNGDIYYPHTASDVVKHGNTTVEKTINNKVGFGDNNAANPRINLFDKCGLDATASNNMGKGTAIRLKWDDENYILVSGVDARFFLKGLNALIVKKDHGSNSKPIEIRDTSDSGVYHNLIGNGNVAIKFLSTIETMQIRNGADSAYANLRASDLSYLTLTSFSDMNLKENIQYIKENISSVFKDLSNIKTNEVSDITELDMHDFINKIDLYSFDYIDAENSNTLGFIAQDIKNDRVGKKLVKEDEEGNLCFNVNSYISCLTGALKEEVRKREALEVKLEEIINRIENL